MALGRTLAVALVGIEGYLVEVEADISTGLPGFWLVGLPDTSLGEARERVRSAAINSGCPLPVRRITVNLSPAGVPKTGTAFDLAIAMALLAADQQVPAQAVRRCVHIGELGLDGRLRPVPGVLPMVAGAVRRGRCRIVLPTSCASEARLVPGADVVAAGGLAQVVALHRGEPPPRPHEDEDEDADPTADVPPVNRWEQEPDLADVVGQHEARHALEVAAAGGHHLLLLGPPGAGKTMLATRLPGLLPDLDVREALEVSAIDSLAGLLHPGRGLARRPPFVDPHHGSSQVSLIGGGSPLPRPGAASRAHHGVLFLDEAAEFAPSVLNALREPLEKGELVIGRAAAGARFPARFQLVLASNPCPCGQATGRGVACSCTPRARRKYLDRLSGPLLDRVDIQIEVHAVAPADVVSDELPEASAPVAARVLAARQAQRARLERTPWRCNGHVTGLWLRRVAKLPRPITQDLDRAMEKGVLTMRGYDRLLRLAWTEADLAGRGAPTRDDVGRALLLRRWASGAL